MPTITQCRGNIAVQMSVHSVERIVHLPKELNSSTRMRTYVLPKQSITLSLFLLLYMSLILSLDLEHPTLLDSYYSAKPRQKKCSFTVPSQQVHARQLPTTH